MHREGYEADPKSRRELLFAHERDSEKELAGGGRKDGCLEVTGRAHVQIDEALRSNRTLQLFVQDTPLGVVDPKLELDHAAHGHFILIGQEGLEGQLDRLGLGRRQQDSGGEEQGRVEIRHALGLIRERAVRSRPEA
jgi:hypothetical protein